MQLDLRTRAHFLWQKSSECLPAYPCSTFSFLCIPSLQRTWICRPSRVPSVFNFGSTATRDRYQTGAAADSTEKRGICCAGSHWSKAFCTASLQLTMRMAAPLTSATATSRLTSSSTPVNSSEVTPCMSSTTASRGPSSAARRSWMSRARSSISNMERKLMGPLSCQMALLERSISRPWPQLVWYICTWCVWSLLLAASEGLLAFWISAIL
mmetsp:Transcript_12844/g.17868  ORF Transcript_12844/g.17868 Transcript_12844/m.17868 type:complete len:211 (-) Transcript_12844:1607-2239(-)